MRLTFWILDGSTHVVPRTVGGDGGQSDLVGQRDSQVGDGVGHEHAALWLLPLQVDLLWQQVLLVLDWETETRFLKVNQNHFLLAGGFYWTYCKINCNFMQRGKVRLRVKDLFLSKYHLLNCDQSQILPSWFPFIEITVTRLLYNWRFCICACILSLACVLSEIRCGHRAQPGQTANRHTLGFNHA